jgi:DNA-binding NarL/FixJ family response regulator
MIRVALLDPHPIVHAGFRSFFKNSKSIFVSGTFSLSKNLFNYLKEKELDILIVEMHQKKDSSVRTVKELRKNYPAIKTLIFTSLPQSIYGITIMKAGAIGFLSKEINRKVMIEAIEKVYYSGFHVVSNYANQISSNFDIRKPRNIFGTLSSREIEVLKLIVEGKRNVEIAQELKLSQKTISTYKTRLMKKLNVKNSVDLFQQTKNLTIF